MKKHIFSGSVFEEKYGHSRAVVAGDTIYVSGTTGYDYATGALPEEAAEQTRQTFRNIEAALHQARTEADTARRQSQRLEVEVTALQHAEKAARDESERARTALAEAEDELALAAKVAEEDARSAAAEAREVRSSSFVVSSATWMSAEAGS